MDVDEIKVLLQKRKHKRFYVHDYAAKIVLNGQRRTFFGGAVSTDEQDAKDRAVYEALERYGCSLVEREVLVSSRATLRKANIPFLDPKDLAPFSNKQFAQDCFPYKPLRDEDEIGWIMNESTSIAVPARAVYFDYQREAERSYMPSVTCGTALHQTFEDAKNGAIKELIERHSCMYYWSRRVTPKPYGLDEIPDERLSNLVRQIRAEGLQLFLLDITTIRELPCFLAITVSGDGPYATFGLAAELDCLKGATKAISEAIMVRNSLDLVLSHHKYKRIARATDITSFMDHSAYYAAKGHARYWNYLLSVHSDEEILHLTATPADEYDFRNIENDCYIFDITPSHYKDIGYFIVRAVCPKFLPMNVRQDAQYLEHPLNKGKIVNHHPHPFG